MLSVGRAVWVTVAATGTALIGMMVMFFVGISTALSDICTDTGPDNCGTNHDTEALIVMVVVWVTALAVVGLVIRAALGEGLRQNVAPWRIVLLAAVWIPLPVILFAVGWSVDHSAHTSFMTATICALAVGVALSAAWCVLLIELCGGRRNRREIEAV